MNRISQIQTGPHPAVVAPVHIRWLIRRDMPEVMSIDMLSFEHPWREEEFLRFLRQRNCIGMIAEPRGQDTVVGFMIYELHKSHLWLERLAVCPRHRRQGIGRQMIGSMIKKLSSHRRRAITIRVRESNLAGQLFFRAQGFAATNVERGWFEDTGEDAYELEYRLAKEAFE
jgi:ribosomal-protein-alanine N-acetyltransferase